MSRADGTIAREVKVILHFRRCRSVVIFCNSAQFVKVFINVHFIVSNLGSYISITIRDRIRCIATQAHRSIYLQINETLKKIFVEANSRATPPAQRRIFESQLLSLFLPC